MIVKNNQILILQNIRANPFDARTMLRKNKRYFSMDPARSKLGAGIMCGLTTLPQEDDVILYLGASAGYTVSFLAQTYKLVMAVEVSPVMCRELVLVAQELGTIAPILADARDPTSYAHRVILAQYVFQDISQPDQVDIFIRNVDAFLSDGGSGVLCLKTRSVNAAALPADIFKNVLDTLALRYTIIEHHSINRYQKDHYLIAIRK